MNFQENKLYLTLKIPANKVAPIYPIIRNEKGVKNEVYTGIRYKTLFVSSV